MLCDEEVHKGAVTSKILQKKPRTADSASKDAVVVVGPAIRRSSFLSVNKGPYLWSSRSRNRLKLKDPVPEQDDLPTITLSPSSKERTEVIDPGTPSVMQVVSHNIRGSPTERSGHTPAIPKTQPAAQLSKNSGASPGPATHSQEYAVEAIPTTTPAEIDKRQMSKRTKPTDARQTVCPTQAK